MLEPIEEIKPDIRSDSSFLLDRVSSTRMRCKNYLNSLEMGKGKVMIMQNRRQILLVPIVLIENLVIIMSTYTTKVRPTISRTLD